MRTSAISDPIAPKDAPPKDWPVFRLGFRPFYLGAAAIATIFMVAWRSVFLGTLLPRSGIEPVPWHAHEMLFGVVAAVIVGFLFTAGKTWTGLPTPRGASLAALFLLWLAARIASLLAPYSLYFALDVTFLPIVAVLFLALLVRAGNQRNWPIAAVVILLAVTNLVFHLAAMHELQWPPLRALYAGLGLVTILLSIIAGRVIPTFTASVTPGLRMIARPRRDDAALVLTAAGLSLWATGFWPLVSAAAMTMGAALHAARLLSWSPWVSRHRPILWILHLSYGWLCLGLGLLAAAQAGLLPVSMGVHALAVGAIGGMLIGMMTRTARGHTGRPLEASKVETTAYVFVLTGAAVRVAAPSMSAAQHADALIVAGALWVIAFTLYIVRFGPWLLVSRLDGKDG